MNAAKKTRTKLHDARVNPGRYQVGASSMGGGGWEIRVRNSLVKPPHVLVLCIQRKDPHDRGRDAVHSCMTALDQARADDELFPTYLLNPERLVIRAPRILDCDPAWTLRLMPVCHECI